MTKTTEPTETTKRATFKIKCFITISTFHPGHHIFWIWANGHLRMQRPAPQYIGINSMETCHFWKGCLMKRHFFQSKLAQMSSPSAPPILAFLVEAQRDLYLKQKHKCFHCSRPEAEISSSLRQEKYFLRYSLFFSIFCVNTWDFPLIYLHPTMMYREKPQHGNCSRKGPVLKGRCHILNEP